MILLFYSHVCVMKEVQSYTPKTYVFSSPPVCNKHYEKFIHSLMFYRFTILTWICASSIESCDHECNPCKKHFVLAVACQICSFRAWLCRATPLKGKCCFLITPTICYCSSSVPPPIFSYRLPPFPHPHFLVNC